MLAKLPQKEVAKALKLVTPHGLAKELDFTYDELRWRMTNGSIPFPSFTLVKRAYFQFEETKVIKANWNNKPNRNLQTNEICATVFANTNKKPPATTDGSNIKDTFNDQASSK